MRGVEELLNTLDGRPRRQRSPSRSPPHQLRRQRSRSGSPHDERDYSRAHSPGAYDYSRNNDRSAGSWGGGRRDRSRERPGRN
jgi:hypothetical protein